MQCTMIQMYFKKKKKIILRPEGFEPPTFGSGIRRAAVAPWPHNSVFKQYIIKLYAGSIRGFVIIPCVSAI